MNTYEGIRQAVQDVKKGKRVFWVTDAQILKTIGLLLDRLTEQEGYWSKEIFELDNESFEIEKEKGIKILDELLGDSVYLCPSKVEEGHINDFVKNVEESEVKFDIIYFDMDYGVIRLERPNLYI